MANSYKKVVCKKIVNYNRYIENIQVIQHPPYCKRKYKRIT